MIRFSELREKYVEVISGQVNLRKELAMLVKRLRVSLEESLLLPERQWQDPATGKMENYLRILVERNGDTKESDGTTNSLYFDEGLGVPCLFALTLDRSQTSFPKTTMSVAVRVSRERDGYRIAVNGVSGKYESTVPIDFNDNDLGEACELIKQVILSELNDSFPAS